jgi:hypothetical protein
MAAGDSSDILSRIKLLMPFRWWNDTAPLRDAVLGGIADGLAFGYSLLSYAKNQTRLATATSFFLDLTAFDFLGLRIKRRSSQSDETFRVTITEEVFRERVTRRGVLDALQDLTLAPAFMFEPKNPNDTGGWGDQFAFDCAGAWGADIPWTFFVAAQEPPGAGIPFLSGFDDPQGGWGAPHAGDAFSPGFSTGFGSLYSIGSGFSSGFSVGFGAIYGIGIGGGAFAFADLSKISCTVTNQDIYNSVEATRAAGVTAWVNIGPKPIQSGRLGFDFYLTTSQLGSSSYLWMPWIIPGQPPVILPPPPPLSTGLQLFDGIAVH